MEKNNLKIKNYDSESRLFKKRVQVIFIFIISLALILIFRLIDLQWLNHSKYRNLALANQIEILPIPPRRGLIYDRNGVLLAKNEPVYTLTVTAEKADNVDETIKKVSEIIPISNQEFAKFQRIRKQYNAHQAMPVKYRLTEEQVAKFYVNQEKFPGAEIQADPRRIYPLKENTAHIIGYVSRISEKDLDRVDSANYASTQYIGKMGVEHSLEADLHGQVGYKEVEVNARGQAIKTLNVFEPSGGDDIYLTIDSKLQTKAIELLGKNAGAVVAIEPSSGQILALASTPSYDPNQFVKGIDPASYKKLQFSDKHPLYNRASRGQFPPGSTIKPFLALDALHEHVIDTNFEIYDPGWFKLPNSKHIFHDWAHYGHNRVNLEKAIIVSCDTFFYHLGVMMGIDRMEKTLRSFGFGTDTGIEDTLSESPGLVPSATWKEDYKGQPWYKGDSVLTGIGQGFLLTTPLQLAVATSTLANHGYEQPPQLILKSVRSNGKIDKPIMKPKKLVLDPNEDAWDTVIPAMEKVVTSYNPWGTAVRFGRHPKYRVAAKTGTAQVYRGKPKTLPDGTKLPRYWHHSLFIAFAPVENPKLAVAVVVEKNRHAEAQVIARKLLDYYLLDMKHEHS